MKAEGKIMSFEGSSRPRSWVLLTAAAILLALGLALAPAAQARDSFALAGNYDFGGQFGTNGPGMMDIHQATDTLYVVDAPNNRILKFDITDPLNPVPENFTALSGNEITEADGSPLVLAAKSNIAVDNSGGPQDGTIYLATNTSANSRAYAYGSDGSFLYTFAHDTNGDFSPTGTPQPARAVAVANDGPRAGEVFRLGTDASTTASYAPALDSGLPPTVAQASPGGSFFFALDSWGAGYTDEGSAIQFFGGLFSLTAYLLNADQFTVAGQFNFGATGTPFDVEVSPDGTVLTRQTSAGGSIGRFDQTGTQNPVSGETGTQLVELFGFGQQGTGFGMAESDQGYIYVTDAANSHLNIFAPDTAPDGEMAETGFVDMTTAQLRADVNAQGLNVTNCEFQWGTTVAYSNPAVPCDVIPSGEGDLTVTADVAVTARTTYHSRIILEADNGTATYSPDFEWQAPDLPEAETMPVGPQQRKGTAVLGGTVDPNETPAGYFIEYSTESDMSNAQRYPANENVPVGDGDSPNRVFETVPGLDNDAGYYFRLVAETKAGSDAGAIESFRTFTEASEPQPTECSNAEFRTGKSALLPDCRAWERVSPADKAGGSVAQGQVIGSDDGKRVTFGLSSAIEGTLGLGITGMNLAERGGGDWSTTPISPAISSPTSSIANNWLYSGFTPSLSRMAGAFLNVDIEGQDGPLQNRTAYLWDTESKQISSMAVGSGGSTVSSVDLAASGNAGAISGSNLDVSEGPASPAGQSSIYWWQEALGLVLASILPNGDPVTTNGQIAMGAMSPSGSKLLWTASNPHVRPGSNEIYLSNRDDSTQWVTEAQGVSQPATTNFIRQGSTPDLRYVYFKSTNALTPDATVQGAKYDLYRFDSETGDLEDLTTTDPNGADVETVMQVTDDGSHIYFLARGNLAAGANGAGLKLFVWHNDQIRYITDYNGYQSNAGLDFGSGRPYERLNRVSSDGRYFLFAHLGSPVGTRMESVYETDGHRMFYRYDLVEDRIDCVNCHPRGLDANSDGYLTTPVRYRPGSAATVGIGPERYFMSDSGEVMFITTQSLVPEDLNTHPDTYLWDGDTRLLTSGKGSHPQWAETATDGFGEIFVLSPSQLVPGDVDHDSDLYVARIGGGLASQQTRPISQGDGCQGSECQDTGAQSPELPRLDSKNSAVAPPPSDKCTRQRAAFQRTAQAMRQRLARFKQSRRVARASVQRFKRGQMNRKRAVRSIRVLKKSKVHVKRVAPMHKRSKEALIRCRGGAS